MLDKPVIVVDFNDKPMSATYIESGAAIGAYNEGAFTTAVSDLWHNDEARRRLAKARHKFILDGKYQPDGQASQRVADLIKQLITGSKVL